MRLRRLYSNKPEIFNTIEFHDGLNVVVGEIRLPENLDRDTHNLGKTLLGEVIDFCLLKKREKDQFLFAHEQFKDFVFLLTIERDDGGFITVRRAVKSASKASILTHEDPTEEFTTAPKVAWDHWELPFDASKRLLEGLLCLSALKPWGFRQAIGFSLRTQKDYDEPFKLAKFAGKHEEWKPLLAHILGLDSQVFSKHFELATALKEKLALKNLLAVELDGLDDRDRLRTRIKIQEFEVQRHEAELEVYNFELADKEINRELVDNLESRIADLNSRRYYLETSKKRIEDSIASKVVVKLDDVRKVFAQSKVYFGDQLTKDFDDLIAFNKAISSERTAYLKTELRVVEDELQSIASSLTALNAERASALAVLQNTNTFSKYKQLSRKLVTLQATLENLQKQDVAVDRLVKLKSELTKLQHEQDLVAEQLQAAIDNAGERYQTIKVGVDAIIYKVLNQHAALYTDLNTSSGNPEYRIEVLGDAGQETDAGRGNTYGRLLCIAFDMAVQQAYADEAFPHFVFHDGVLETLETRKKLNLIDVMREHTSHGLQQIITVLDSELPFVDGVRFAFDDDEVILRLHDEGHLGRLFKMPTW